MSPTVIKRERFFGNNGYIRYIYIYFIPNSETEVQIGNGFRNMEENTLQGNMDISYGKILQGFTLWKDCIPLASKRNFQYLQLR